MNIQLLPIADIIPYSDNPRIITDSAVTAVAESIARYGFRQPIVVDGDMVIIVGHTRLLAAVKLGYERIPVHIADMTPEQAQAYRIADNRSGEYAEWDSAKLTAELRSLESSFSLDNDIAELEKLTAFSVDEIDYLLTEHPLISVFDAPPDTAPPDTLIELRFKVPKSKRTPIVDAVERILKDESI